jgi:hypothetical protein
MPEVRSGEPKSMLEAELLELIEAAGVSCARIYRIWERGADLSQPWTEMAIFVTEDDEPMTVRVGAEGQFELLAGW